MKYLIWASALGLFTGVVHAQYNDDEQDQAELLELLAEETDLATRTLQNADFVPGIVSVLQASELHALGKRTVLDALALVPGIETIRDQNGAATLRVRSLDFFFNSGNVKVLVDGLDLAAETSSFNSGVLLMPISQVERIEVIRGPGSNLHGDFAFSGLINIVTRQSSASIALALGEGQARSATVTLGQKNAGAFGDWDYGANLSSTDSDRYDAPENRPAREHRSYANVHVARAGFSLKSAAMKRHHARRIAPNGPPNGPVPPPPPPIAPLPRGKRERLHTTELRYDHAFGSERSLGLGLTRQNANNSEQQNSFDGGYSQLSGDGLWRTGRHLLLFEAQYARLQIDRATLMPALGVPNNNAIRPFGDQRDYYTVMLQDQVDLNERLTLTAGLRHDTLAGVDARITPRVALVWRTSDLHTLKLQYAEGFRTPTFVELYSRGVVNPDLDFEVIKSFELGYLLRLGSSSLRATAFRQSVDNLILREQTPGGGHDNSGAVRVDGVELEWNQSIGAGLNLLSSLSLVDTDDTRGAARGQRIDSFGEASVIGNLSLIARPSTQWTAGVHWNHLGERSASESPDVDGYDRVDLALTHHLRSGVDLSLSLRNALDQDIQYIARVPPGRIELNDYSARLWTFEVQWDF
jgi:iron complex outermembrane receptor protein